MSRFNHPVSRSWLSTLAVLLVSTSIGGCSDGGTKSPYPIIDSGVWAEGWPHQGIYWIDDDELLFIGTVHHEYPRPAKPGTALMRWKLGGAIEVYRERIDDFCYRDGRIWQRRGAWSDAIYFQGTLGQEREVPRRGFLDRMNCRWRDAKPGDRGRESWILLDRHGYLDLGDPDTWGDDNASVHYHDRQEDRRIELPFGRAEIWSPTYYPFRDAYLLPGMYYDEQEQLLYWRWPRDIPQKVWWLTPDGDATAESFPLGPWNDGGGSVIITAVGRGAIVIYHGGTSGPKEPGAQGLYLVFQDTFQKILDGYVMSPATSPDGCRLAVAHAPSTYHDRTNAHNRRTLKVIDFCRRGEGG